MKKIVLIVVLLLILFTKSVVGYSASVTDEMIDLASAVTESELAIDNWQVTIKEQISHEKAYDVTNKLKNGYLVSTAEDENIIKYSFSDVHKSDDLDESFKVVIPKNTNYQAEVIAVIRGDFWNESVEQAYISTKSALPDYLFSKDAERFACLTTDSSGTIKSDYFLNEFSEKLNVQQKLTQTDKLKNTSVAEILYGYTPLWDQKITIMDKSMNVQIAINKSKDEGTKFTIGTPILITEY
ncbi:YwmB family TATA-box binding protein [Lentibacillus sp. Marseille-P4043]|uniref:YwmB family TATA-box binding protein n=1 Tax=Lentibacillus sp. Marseille-P4043 TaxID=2040293 RepID=UPI000D0B7965|nr:YwmB family TATA-box binding protein [Lentibacillus sp. Marseille-P4043]